MLLSLVLHALVLALLADLPVVRSSGVAPLEPLRVSVRVLPETSREPVNDTERHAVSHGLRRPAVVGEHVARQPEGAVPPAPVFSMSAAPTEAPPNASTLPSENGNAWQVPGGIPQQMMQAAPVTVAIAKSDEVPAVDAAGLRQFRLALASEARRVRHYPEAARRAGFTGTAEVRVSVNALSQRYAELAHSSGHAVLDEAALDMLRIAAERSPLPESLRGKEFAVQLPVVFAVDE